ncbi:AlkA N-terminal domain-containing protein [Streptomyces lydicus]|uniref:AlkA N-terminal domain-containing protein n=1 Tax=Streptomyces lydicus TaxID=47763 RepID=UPI001F50E3ED|nr:AlkA N-terminal domain-containing protein [Streptomyces lydicus]
MPVRRIRRLCDLDATPYAVASRLGADPLFGPLVAERPGPRSLDAADAGHGGRRGTRGMDRARCPPERAAALVWRYGTPRDAADGGPIRLFSEPGGELTGLGGRGAGPRAVHRPRRRRGVAGRGHGPWCRRTGAGRAARGRPAGGRPRQGARAGSTRMRGGGAGEGPGAGRARVPGRLTPQPAGTEARRSSPEPQLAGTGHAAAHRIG